MALSALPIIVNATAGSAHGVEDTISAVCREHGVRADVLRASSGAELVSLTRRVLAERPRRIAAAGGDGTLNAVAGQVFGSATELAVLPLGTLNHFAKDLGIPLELEDAVRTAITGQVTAVDVGRVNDTMFLNNSSLGLYPRLVRMRERQQRRFGRSKWIAAAWAAWALLWRYSLVTVTLDVDGRQVTRRTPLVFIGNNRYVMQGVDIGARARLDEGTLVVYVPRVTSRMGLLKLMVGVMVGSPRMESSLEQIAAAGFAISARRAHLLVATDGEVHTLDTPLRYSVHPGALRVVAPPLADRSRRSSR